MLETWGREGKVKSLKDGNQHVREMNSARFAVGINDIEMQKESLHRWKALEVSREAWDQEQMGKGRGETKEETQRNGEGDKVEKQQGREVERKTSSRGLAL